MSDDRPRRLGQRARVGAPEELAADLAEEADALDYLARETEAGSALRAAKYASASSSARLLKRGRAYHPPPVSPVGEPNAETEPEQDRS
jgi:Ca-activated chloride channel family protein